MDDVTNNPAPQYTGAPNAGPAKSQDQDESPRPPSEQGGRDSASGKRPQEQVDQHHNNEQAQRPSDGGAEQPHDPSDDRALVPVQPATEQSVAYLRTKEQVVAFMIPLPLPQGRDGAPIDVPGRFLLYLPPEPDLLKPPKGSVIKERGRGKGFRRWSNLLKPRKRSGVKERERDKALRRWQNEVCKAKTHRGRLWMPTGWWAATIRGSIWCVKIVQRSELAFLSRLPRSTLREITFLYPAAADDGTKAMTTTLDDRRRFVLIKEEFKRNAHAAKRDFWIGVALLLPVEAADIVGAYGLFGVFAVWVIYTGLAWQRARGIRTRLVLQDGGTTEGAKGEQHQQAHGNGGAYLSGANDGAASDSDDEIDALKNGDAGNKKEEKVWSFQFPRRTNKGPKPRIVADEDQDLKKGDAGTRKEKKRWSSRLKMGKNKGPKPGIVTEDEDQDLKKGDAGTRKEKKRWSSRLKRGKNEGPKPGIVTEDEDGDVKKGDAGTNKENKRWSSRFPWRRNRGPKPPIVTLFNVSASLDPLARYVQAACHTRHPDVFSDVGDPDTEEAVLTSIGWAPTRREFPDDADGAKQDADVAWQIRQATEDLIEAVTKTAKRWDKHCKSWVKDPVKARQKADRKREKKRLAKEKRVAKRAAKQAKKEERNRTKSGKEGKGTLP